MHDQNQSTLLNIAKNYRQIYQNLQQVQKIVLPIAQIPVQSLQ